MNILPEEYSEPIDLTYYLGKVCTVLIDRLVSFQCKMTPEEATQSFTGVVNTIDSNGVCITDLISKTRNFFFYNHIVALREERVLNPDDPKDQEEIAIIQKAMNVKAKEKPVKEKSIAKIEQMESIGKESAFVNLEDLQRLAKESKNNLK